MKRRDFIWRSGISALAASVGTSFLNACHTEEDMIGEPNWIIEGAFVRPLNVPPVISGSVSLQAGAGAGELLEKGVSSVAYSYGNGILGPTIKTATGATVHVSLQNRLNEETNIHWHGLILPENMDGHPKDTAMPSGTLDYVLPIRQRAGTYWYHPHPHGLTARQVFMGLAGMFIVNDEEETSLNLPSGNFEIPIIIQDKRFKSNQLVYAPNNDEMMTGYLGEHILVNGQHAPVVTVSADWYRLRLLNGSTARVYNLQLTGGVPMFIIGSDGGLLESPEAVSGMMLAPGERIDVLVNFSNVSPGQDIFLVSNKFSKYNVQGRQAFSIMKFSVQTPKSASFTLPPVLSIPGRISPAESTTTRSFDIAQTVATEGRDAGMGRHSIGGKTFDMHRVDETVQAGTTEIWEFDNSSGDEIHPMHIHGVQFQLLGRSGGRNAILPWEKGWKDTVLVMPGERVRVIMTFPEYTGVFVFHCHNLEHEDDGMMLNYRIT